MSIARVINIVHKDAPEDHSYWFSRTPEERIAAVDELREEYFRLFHYKLIGLIEPDENGKRLRRVYRITQRA